MNSYNLSITVATSVECWLFTQRKLVFIQTKIAFCLLSIFFLLQTATEGTMLLLRMFTTSRWKNSLFFSLEKFGKREEVIYPLLPQAKRLYANRLYTNNSRGHHGGIPQFIPRPQNSKEMSEAQHRQWIIHSYIDHSKSPDVHFLDTCNVLP